MALRSVRTGKGAADWLSHDRRVGVGLRCLVERSKIFAHRTRLTLLVGPIEFIRRLAVIATGIGLHHARVDGEAFALDQAHRHPAHTTRSKIWRSRSLSRKRPSRFSEKVEWCGTLSPRSSLQNHR